GPGGSGADGGGSGTGGGGGSAGALPGQGLEQLSARVRPQWRVRRRFTQLRRLTVTDLPLAASVRIVCRGRHCPVRRRNVAVRRGRAVTTRLRRVKLLPG
ncbi:MAG TPA: hypothetical protein VGW10_03210, partial [Solirubrobacteraceae bacterium]|nr:hypothetical protein [Solirubrobacteraceae bacterium]